jgi:hypothetical protein
MVVMGEDSSIGKETLARIEHIGRGKFIVHEAEDSIYTGRTVDASNISKCTL